MFKIDNSTAATALPTPAAAGTPGYFTGGNPGSGVAATILDADFMNMLQEELNNVVTGAGLTPSKTTYNQVATALNTLYAKLAGNAAQTFLVAPATASGHAVNLGQFTAVNGTSNSVTLPNGLIIKWGIFSTAAVASGGNLTGTLTLPTAFPNGALFSAFSMTTTSNVSMYCGAYDVPTATGGPWFVNNPSAITQTPRISYLFIGY